MFILCNAQTLKGAKSQFPSPVKVVVLGATNTTAKEA